MFKKAGVLFFYTLTPLHPGSGASVAAVDLPIQRERHTKFPMIQASGVKGALRDLASHLVDNGRIKIVFGPETDGASEHGGALALTDARILLFPVRSVKGVFTWITCQGVIERLKRDLGILRATNGNQSSQALGELESIQLPALDPKARQASTPQNSQVVLSNNQIILEDFCFELPKDAKRDQVGHLADWLGKHALPQGLDYWKEKLKTDLVLLADDDFVEFLEMSTEVITRIKLGEKGTVDAGPWDEEHLPSETVLYSLALATDPKLAKEQLNEAPIKNAEGVLNFLKNDLVAKAKVTQFGGDETVGKGLVYVRFFDGQQAKQGSQQGQGEGQSPGGEKHDG